MKIIYQLLLVGMFFVCFDLLGVLRLDGSSVPTQTTSLPTDVAILPSLALPALVPATLSRDIQENGTPMGETKFAVGKSFLPLGPRPDTGRG